MQGATTEGNIQRKEGGNFWLPRGVHVGLKKEGHIGYYRTYKKARGRPKKKSPILIREHRKTWGIIFSFILLTVEPRERKEKRQCRTEKEKKKKIKTMSLLCFWIFFCILILFFNIMSS